MPSLSDDEREALRQSIAALGVLQPIVVDENGTIIDGHHRAEVAAQLGVECPTKVMAGLSEDEKLETALVLNLGRRHLDGEQKHALVAELRRRGLSLRWISERTGIPRSTVSRQVARVPDGTPERVTGLDGKTYAVAELAKLGEDSPVIMLSTHDSNLVPYPAPKSEPTFNQTPGEGISWAAWSWNPVTGCLHGCPYCYARELATSDRLRKTYPAGFTPLFHEERLDAPAHTSIPAAYRDDPAWRRVFVCSMADLYGRWVPDTWIEKVHAAMLANSQWEYLLLTKFPTRYSKVALPPGAWVGTSVDEQRRVPIAEKAFEKISGVKVKWLSLEPLKAPLKFNDLSMFDWVVIGAQTRTLQPDGEVPAFAPPIEWVISVIDQAHQAGCKVHCKPNLLGRTSPDLPGMQLPDEFPEHG
jgi:protein gp37